jgi:hypothetical protein
MVDIGKLTDKRERILKREKMKLFMLSGTTSIGKGHCGEISMFKMN